MRVPCVRFTIRKMMGMVALTGFLLPSCFDLIWEYRIVDFETIRVVDNKPLHDPIRIMQIEPGESGSSLILADGRVIVLEDGPLLAGEVSWEEEHWPSALVDVEPEPGGFARVYMSQLHWYCNSSPRSRRTPWLRIPLFTRIRERRFRHLIGRGKIVARPPSAARHAFQATWPFEQVLHPDDVKLRSLDRGGHIVQRAPAT